MQNRRIRERRSLKSRPRYLMQAGRGGFRLLDRRRRPDRRLNNIHTEFIPLEEFYKFAMVDPVKRKAGNTYCAELSKKMG